MSIAALAASTFSQTSQPTVLQALILPVGMVVFALIAGALARVWSPRAIVGPVRISASETISNLPFIMAIGFLAYIAPLILYLQHTHTTPGSHPLREMYVSLVDYAMGILVMLLMGFALRPAGSRLGLRLKKYLPRALLQAVLAAIVLAPILFVLMLANAWWMQRFHPGENFSHPLIKSFQEHGPGELHTLIIISAVVFAPMAEELFFRGYLQTFFSASLRQFGSRPHVAAWMAVFATSTLFAAIHPEGTRIVIFVLAMGLGYVYERTANLWTSIILHSLFNATSFVILMMSR